MANDVFTYLVGGKAGEGVKKAGIVAAQLFAGIGRHVFEMDDYQSLIKGGHNFSVVSTANREITSHYIKADLVVSLDKRSYEMHSEHLSKRGIHVYNSDAVPEGAGLGLPMTAEAQKYPNPKLRVGVAGAAVLAAALGMKKDELKTLIEKEYPRDIENNIAYASALYELALPELNGRFSLKNGDKTVRPIITGNEAIALGAVAGGLDAYFAYPMTPASSILHVLAEHAKKLGVAVVHPENEIAVANMAIGATFSGAKAMVGSSGGGFALMEEALSLAGMAESPLLTVLSSRPGPSTGVPTYTEQADLKFALNQGHGEFPRFVASPGTIEEAYHLTAEMLALVWKFQTPGILLTEKHLSESRMTVEIDNAKTHWAEATPHTGGEYKRYLDTPNGVSPLLFPPTRELNKWNSYESDESGITTESPAVIAAMHDKRAKKSAAINKYMRTVKTFNTFGKKGPVIMTYGSTLMSVLEALEAADIKAHVIQPIYLCPLPVWELGKYKNKEVIVVEQSCTGQFAELLEEKAGIEPKAVIKRYDGRPFDPAELAHEIKLAIK